MSEEVSRIANGPVMWSIALITIAVVIVQAALIYRMTRKYAKAKKALTPEEMKTAFRTGGIVAIGPAISVFILALTMINLLGAPATLMRIGIIGSAPTEMSAATVGALMAGTTLGAQELTLAAYGTALFGCAIMSCGYLILIPLISRGLAKPLQKLFAPPEDGAKPSKLSVFFGAVFPMLVFGLLAATQVAQGIDYLAVLVVAAAAMFILNRIAQAKNIRWLKEWSMGFAVLIGMAFGPLFGMIF